MMVDFKFDALILHRKPIEVELVGKVSEKSVYWLVELVVPHLHRECNCTL